MSWFVVQVSGWFGSYSVGSVIEAASLGEGVDELVSVGVPAGVAGVFAHPLVVSRIARAVTADPWEIIFTSVCVGRYRVHP